MKYFFLGGIYPPDKIDSILNKSFSGLDIASHNLQLTYIKGLRNYYKELEVISVMPVKSFPNGYKDLFIPNDYFNLNNYCKNFSLGYINFPILKQFSILLSLYYNFRTLFFDKIKITFFAYGLSTPKLLFLYFLKTINKGVKIVLYVPDLPNYMSSNKNILYKIAKHFDQKLIYFSLSKIDKYILVTPYMAKKLNVKKNNYLVIEGIYSNCHETISESIKETYPTIMYAGGIDIKYGVQHLITAFMKTKNPNFKLWLFGTGADEDKLKKFAENDSRIFFFGFTNPKIVTEMQRKATLLVNPRLSSYEFTMYSFPSKTIEFLGSGTPTIIYKTKGVPEEYYDYCLVPENESVCCLSELLEKFCSYPPSTLYEIGMKARKFIQEKKSLNFQLNSIYHFVEN